MTSVNEKALNKPRPTNHTECKLARSEICPSICCVLHYGKCIIKAWSHTRHSVNACKVYINSDISLDSSYKLQIVWYATKPRFYIPEFCVFVKFVHFFLKVPGQIPIIKIFHRFYTILGGPLKKNTKLVFYCIYNFGSLGPNTSHCLPHYLHLSSFFSLVKQS